MILSKMEALIQANKNLCEEINALAESNRNINMRKFQNLPEVRKIYEMIKGE